MRSALLASAVLLLACGTAAAQEAMSEEVRRYVRVDTPVVALTNVTVVDGTGTPPKPDHTVIIRGDSIAAVGPSSRVRPPPGAEVLDLEGHTVAPGFVGLHQHLFYSGAYGRGPLPYSAPRLYLGAGVTTARTAGAYAPYAELNLARRIEAGRVPGPTIVATGPYLTGEPDNWYQVGVRTPDEAREVVRHWTVRGATWFKVDATISRAVLGAAVEEAHRRGARVTGHLCSVTFAEAVERGIDNLEHGYITNSGLLEGKRPDRCPADSYDRLAELDIESAAVDSVIETLVRNDVALTSTLAVIEAVAPDRGELEPRTLRAMEPRKRASSLESWRDRDREAGTEPSTWAKLLDNEMEFERKFVAAGGLLAAGADPTGNGEALPGFADQRNFELLVEAGFPPVRAFRIMTLNGAEVLGLEDRIGSVEPGKEADLLVIRGDPVEDRRSIRDVELVFREGVGYDSRSLIRSVDGRVGAR